MVLGLRNVALDSPPFCQHAGHAPWLETQEGDLYFLSQPSPSCSHFAPRPVKRPKSLFDNSELSVRRYDFSRLLAVFGLQHPRLTTEVVTAGIFQMRSKAPNHGSLNTSGKQGSGTLLSSQPEGTVSEMA